MVLGDAPRLAQLKRFLARATSGGSRHLMDALEKVGVYEEKIGAMKKRIDELGGVDVAPPPLISGDDLEAEGLKPGPVFKKVLDATYDEQLEGRVKSKEGAMEFAMRQARGGSSA